VKCRLPSVSIAYHVTFHELNRLLVQMNRAATGSEWRLTKRFGKSCLFFLTPSNPFAILHALSKPFPISFPRFTARSLHSSPFISADISARCHQYLPLSNRNILNPSRWNKPCSWKWRYWSQVRSLNPATLQCSTTPNRCHSAITTFHYKLSSSQAFDDKR